MTLIIELSDEQAATLQAKAAKQGLTIEGWIQRLTAEQPEEASTPRTVQEAIARIRELQQHVKPDPEGWTVRDYIDYGRR